MPKRDPEVNTENQLHYFGEKKRVWGFFFFKTFPLSEHLALFNSQFNQVDIAKLSILHSNLNEKLRLI